MGGVDIASKTWRRLKGTNQLPNAGVRNRCVLRLWRQDRDRLDLEQKGRVGEARDLHQRRGGKRLAAWRRWNLTNIETEGKVEDILRTLREAAPS